MAHYYFENTPHGKRKDGTKLNTATHFDYISREGDYANMKNRQEDLKITSFGNLPEWADNPHDFWEQAEKYRSKPNGRAYREFKFALQEELTLEENIQCIEKFLKETGIKDNHVYSYAIHDKVATFSKEHRNIHCHLMFCEKIIEKNRPLEADMYFKNYAKNKLGEPTKGYRSSTQFTSKQATHNLRKLFADIINDKFQEKGLDISISEKSLKAQRQELLKQGKMEEAELLNRTPAPHLGNAYKNPAVLKRIMEKIDETNKKADEAADGFIIQEKEKKLSIQEQKIQLFANDVVIRQVAKQIQQERLRLRKEQQAKKIIDEAEKIKQEAIIITTNDICIYLDIKIKELEEKTAESLTAFKAAQKNILNEQYINLLAKDRMFNNNYSKDIKQYGILSKELKQIDGVLPTLYGKADKIKELCSLIRKRRELNSSRTKIGKRINAYKTELTTNNEKYNSILNQLKKENEDSISKNKILYARYKHNMLQVQKYKTALDKLTKEDKNTIIFNDNISSKLEYKNKLNGITPLIDLPSIVNNNNIYFIFDQNKNKAVKIGDDIIQGKVPVYYLKTDNVNISIQKSNEFAFLYAQKEQTSNISQNKLNEHPIIQKAYKQRQIFIVDKISKIADNIVMI
ncbi:MobA/MobL family protein [uncultured Parvimonas sp.]|uniref:MobA/MobL family protein n=1 Tax=uncultured Parvimonas sp. TaxID=747372 RepID=UPI002803A195|nr:MobA/MobL family protein [uncultured Parvimonas sp.]